MFESRNVLVKSTHPRFHFLWFLVFLDKLLNLSVCQFPQKRVLSEFNVKKYLLKNAFQRIVNQQVR